MVFWDRICGITYKNYHFSHFILSRMWEITFWFTRNRRRISSMLSNWIFKYQIYFILCCFLSKLISLFIICNSSLLGWLEYLYSIHICFRVFFYFEINKVGRVFVTTMGILITLVKTYVFLFIRITTRWTLPRLRMDQQVIILDGNLFFIFVLAIYY
jgi:hypothetical protein